MTQTPARAASMPLGPALRSAVFRLLQLIVTVGDVLLTMRRFPHHHLREAQTVSV